MTPTHPTHLIDTDWVIHYLNGNAEVIQRLRKLEAGALAISVVSLAELWEGVYYSKDPGGSEAVLNNFVRGNLVLGIDEETCKVFGKERGRLRSRKKKIADFDLLIGSTALQHNLMLLTNNRRDFDQIEGLEIVSIDAPPQGKSPRR